MSGDYWNIFMKKKYSFEFLQEPFEEWYNEKADEIYDSGERAAKNENFVIHMNAMMLINPTLRHTKKIATMAFGFERRKS